MNERSPSEDAVPTLRTRIRQATDGAILAAAEEIFADQGLYSARMGDIAARAGVAVGTLYNHFADREALLAELLQVRRAELLETVDDALAQATGQGFRAALTQFVGAFFDFVEHHRKFFHILMQGEHATATAGNNPKAAVYMAEFSLRTEKLMKRGVREKVLRPESLDLYPALLGGMLKGLIMRDRRLGNTGPVADVERVVEFFLHGAEA